MGAHEEFDDGWLLKEVEFAEEPVLIAHEAAEEFPALAEEAPDTTEEAV